MKSNNPTRYELAQFDYLNSREFHHIYDRVESYLGNKSSYLFRVITSCKGLTEHTICKGLVIAYPTPDDVADAISELNFFLEQFDLAIAPMNGHWYVHRAVTELENSKLAKDGDKAAKDGQL